MIGREARAMVNAFALGCGTLIAITLSACAQSTASPALSLGPATEVYHDVSDFGPKYLSNSAPGNQGVLIFDAPLSTVQLGNTMRFLMANGPGIDVFDVDLSVANSVENPFGTLSSGTTGTPVISTYNASASHYITDAWSGLPNNNPAYIFGGTAAPWIPNVYKVTDRDLNALSLTGNNSIRAGDLLGFVHLEKQEMAQSFEQCTYTVGLAYSTDNGSHWRYVGNIIQEYIPYGAQVCLTGCSFSGNGTWTSSAQYPTGYGLHIIAGVPYLVIHDAVSNFDYLYVYYNEFTGNYQTFPDNLSEERQSVARAPLNYVLAMASTGRRPVFNKYTGGGTWSQKDAGSTADPDVGASVLPASYTATWPDPANPGNNLTFLVDAYDIHSDAAYCPALGKNLLTAATGYNNPSLALFSSDKNDGVNWTYECEMDRNLNPRYIITQEFSFFVSTEVTDNGITVDDGHYVGNPFYIFWPRHVTDTTVHPKPYEYWSLYRTKVAILNPLSRIRRSLQMANRKKP